MPDKNRENRVDYEEDGGPNLKLSEELAMSIAKQLRFNLKEFPLEQLITGLRIETEHKDTVDPEDDQKYQYRDWIMYGKIVRDHVRESPHYYEELVKMEKKLNIESLVPSIVDIFCQSS